MARITETPVRGFAHCRNAVCPGYTQEEVDALEVLHERTYAENGGDGVFASSGMVESSSVSYQFADTDEAPCVSCGVPREVTGDPRPEYQPLSGHDPHGLLAAAKFDPAKQATIAAEAQESDVQMEARLRAKIREEQLEAKLRKELEG